MLYSLLILLEREGEREKIRGNSCTVHTHTAQQLASEWRIQLLAAGPDLIMAICGINGRLAILSPVCCRFLVCCVYMYKRPNFWVESIVRRRAVCASGPYIFHEKDFPSSFPFSDLQLSPSLRCNCTGQSKKGPVYVSASYVVRRVSRTIKNLLTMPPPLFIGPVSSCRRIHVYTTLGTMDVVINT